jgi:hypothetical protein
MGLTCCKHVKVETPHDVCTLLPSAALTKLLLSRAPAAAAAVQVLSMLAALVSVGLLWHWL